MKTIHRIFIAGQHGNCGDPAYKFVADTLKRRYGNACTFALTEEVESILKQLKDAGFEAKLDGYSWSIPEPLDYEKGKTVCLQNDFAQNIAVLVTEIIENDPVHGKIAKVKYVDLPRKKSFWIKAQTQQGFEDELKKALNPYGY